jgi:hypothetical protein
MVLFGKIADRKRDADGRNHSQDWEMEYGNHEPSPQNAEHPTVEYRTTNEKQTYNEDATNDCEEFHSFIQPFLVNVMKLLLRVNLRAT